MAQANISVTESQFRCPICLEVLNDPVSIPCGHTYCMRCINKYWDQVDATSQFSCPQCRDAFSPRPVLRRNTVLAELVDKLKLSSEASFLSTASPDHYMGGVGDVACDFCPIDSKLKAVKSCLVCLASFCEMHVLPHREVGTLRRHKLVAAVECLADRLCAQHRLGLEPSGTGADGEVAEEWTGDCLLCEADHEEIHNVDGQRARRRLQLQESHRLLQGRTQTAERDLEEFQQSLESFKVSASVVVEDSDALFADVALRLEKIRAEVRARLEAKERAVVGRAEREVEAQQREVEELRRREEEISLLLETDDNTTHYLQTASLLCQPPPSGRRCRTPSLPMEPFSTARKALCHFRSRMEEVSSEEVDKISSAINENCVSGGECFKDATKRHLEFRLSHGVCVPPSSSSAVPPLICVPAAFRPQDESSLPQVLLRPLPGPRHGPPHPGAAGGPVGGGPLRGGAPGLPPAPPALRLGGPGAVPRGPVLGRQLLGGGVAWRGLGGRGRHLPRHRPQGRRQALPAGPQRALVAPALHAHGLLGVARQPQDHGGVGAVPARGRVPGAPPGGAVVLQRVGRAHAAAHLSGALLPAAVPRLPPGPGRHTGHTPSARRPGRRRRQGHAAVAPPPPPPQAGSAIQLAFSLSLSFSPSVPVSLSLFLPPYLSLYLCPSVSISVCLLPKELIWNED